MQFVFMFIRVTPQKTTFYKFMLSIPGFQSTDSTMHSVFSDDHPNISTVIELDRVLSLLLLLFVDSQPKSTDVKIFNAQRKF